MVELSDSQQLFVRPEFEVLAIDESSVLLRSPEKGVRVRVEGMAASELVETLLSVDGSQPFGALREHGRGFVDIVGELVARDIIRPGSADSLPAESRSFARAHNDPKSCCARLSASRVAVCGADDLAEHVRRGLRESGVQSQEWPSGNADLIIACLRSPRDSYAELIDEQSRDRKIPWLSLLVFGDAGFVGPLFLPNEGPCLRCVRSREAANWTDPELTALYYEAIARNNKTATASGSLPAYLGLVSYWGVLEATKFLAQFRVPVVLGTVLRLDFARAQAEPHRVFVVPRCRGCSPGVVRPPVDGQLFASA